jgi:hypothetical protein
VSARQAAHEGTVAFSVFLDWFPDAWLGGRVERLDRLGCASVATALDAVDLDPETTECSVARS